MAPRTPTLNHSFAIKLNTAEGPRPCPLCDDTIEPLVGPEVYISPTWEMICWACAGEHAPDLLDVLYAAYKLDLPLAIKMSTSDEPADCALCGEPAEPLVDGPDLFLAESQAIVCWDCGAIRHQELVDMLMAYYQVGEEAKPVLTMAA